MFLEECSLDHHPPQAVTEKMMDYRSDRLQQQQERLYTKRCPENTFQAVKHNVHLPNATYSPPKLVDDEPILKPTRKIHVPTFDPSTEVATSNIKEIVCDDLFEEKIKIDMNTETKLKTTLAGLDLSDIRKFITSPVPKNTLILCQIQRSKKGLKNRIYPTYELTLKENSQFLLAARKRPKNKTSNYIISRDPQTIDRNDHQSYVGKLRSNFVGTEFTMFDNGINPKNANQNDDNIIRKELCSILFESNIFGSRGPRKMTVLIPSLHEGQTHVWQPKRADESMVSKYKENDSSNIIQFTNRAPRWNEQVGAYVLNFSGRVTMASVKNFQLVQQEDTENVILQFGRIGKDAFTMDVQYPMSILQAFSICLSSFDYKIACE